MSITDIKVMSQEEVYKEKFNTVSAANLDLRLELEALRATNPLTSMQNLQSKVIRQASALNILNRRVRTQRLILRKLNELERDLTEQEWNEVKAQNADHFENHTTLYI